MRSLFSTVCSACALAACLMATQSANAALSPLWGHDINGNIGTIDLTTNSVNIIGNAGIVFTDIAFSPTGELYAMDFTKLYRVDKTTLATTLIGNHGISSGNALVFNDSGTLFAMGNLSTSLFTLNTTTAARTNLGNVGFASAGDLAFYNGELFLSSTTNQLINLDLSGPTASGSAVGNIGYTDVFGLATTADNQLIALSQTNVLSVNPVTGQGSVLFNYSGQGLGVSFGSAFFEEAGAVPTAINAVPEPATATCLLLASVAITMVVSGRRGGAPFRLYRV